MANVPNLICEKGCGSIFSLPATGSGRKYLKGKSNQRRRMRRQILSGQKSDDAPCFPYQSYYAEGVESLGKTITTTGE